MFRRYDYVEKYKDIVIYKSISRQRPQNTHMSDNKAAVFSLCLCSLCMRIDFTQQCIEST
jgi:hypothetical protein